MILQSIEQSKDQLLKSTTTNNWQIIFKLLLNIGHTVHTIVMNFQKDPIMDHDVINDQSDLL